MIRLKKYLFLLVLVIPFYANSAEAMENSDKKIAEDSQNQKMYSLPASQAIQETTQDDHWGQTTWTFKNGVLQVSGGSIDLDNTKSPWLNDLISMQAIQEINFTDDVHLKGDASMLFATLTNLEKINVEKLDVSEVVNMNTMFGLCFKINELNVTNWDTRNVKDMSSMFLGNTDLTSIDISNWDTTNVSTTLGMFTNTSNLVELKLGSRSIFKGNIGIIGNLDGYTSKWIGLNTGKVYNSGTDLSNDYDGSSPDTFVREKRVVKDWGTTKYEFYDGVLTFTGGEVDLNEEDSPWQSKEVDGSKITEIKFEDTVYLKGDASSLFADLRNLMFINAEKLDVHQVTMMKGMFSGSKVLELDLSGWDTSNVQDMSYMFGAAQHLSKLNVADWDTSKVQDMSSMFSFMPALREINIGDWDTSKVQDMSSMFINTSNLKEINLDKWNTSAVKTMRFMFAKTVSLKEIYISSWDISNTTDLSYMFLETRSLEKLDISNWDLAGKNTTDMFLFSNLTN